MSIRRGHFLIRALLLAAMLGGTLGFMATPTVALSLNPLDYYTYDYYIALSHTEVMPGELFSVTAVASVRCTKDMPIGIREATIQFKVLAEHESSQEELSLSAQHVVHVRNVPDWAGDEYSATESVELRFPAETALGTYELIAYLDYVSLDGWNVTSMIPSSARSVALGSITCALPDAPPTPFTPPTPAEPGVLFLSVLGHEFRPAIDADGYLLEEVNAILVEGLLSIQIAAGTRCLDASGAPLVHLSASQQRSPGAPHAGVVLRAFSIRPDGSSVTPPLRLSMPYKIDELPLGCKEDQLSIGYYDRTDGGWHQLPSSVDPARKEVTAEVQHFSVFGLLAPTSTPGPARFSVSGLDISPTEVAPFGRVNVVITIANTGDTADTYPLLVRVDGLEEHSQSVLLQPRQSRVVRLTVIRSFPGTYQITVEELVRSFVVTTISTTSPTAPPTMNPTTSPTQPASEATGQAGMNPVYIALLVLVGIAFFTLVILILAGAL